MILQVLLSLSVIGFLNFLVSFGLALGLAIRSRNINFKQTGQLVILLIKHFLKRPTDYFFPPGN
jgi:site-specific recombinase